MSNVKLFTLTTLVCVLSACASKSDKNSTTTADTPAPRRDTTSIEAKQVAAEAEASTVTEISFVKGKSDLTAGAKKSLRNVVTKARKLGELDEIKVISWGDQEYPSVNTGELSEAQQKLAAARNDSIRNYLRSIDKNISADYYNMAERPNALERVMATSDARMKRSLEMAGIPNTDTSVKTPSRASKSIVMVILED